MPNRLAASTSPYLLQHKDNPVDWWPWCDEAWEKALEEDRPVFLSVGYSSCHWCHVMAHESFEDEEVAEALNRSFISIKLDREERPDVDEVYMTAVQLANGHGGWPMSVFLTPGRKPVFAGTYFPKAARGQQPGFLNIVNSLARAWKDQRPEVEQAADEFATALAAALEKTLPSTTNQLDVSLLDHAVELLHQDFDEEHGGFGSRPKFPPHAALRFLLDYAQIRDALVDDGSDLSERAGHMALYTLEQIVLGGIHDHVGGGFHRYSTDESWLLPHFEKMLYDNAQLLSALRAALEASEDDRLRSLFGRAADQTAEWIARELTAADGLFMSALDADSDGREGAYYTWTMEELSNTLGHASEPFATAFRCRPEGNFNEESSGKATGENILHLSNDIGGEFGPQLRQLLEARSARARPLTDHKCVASWNGLTIGALAKMGRLDMAISCAEQWRRHIESPAGLPHMVTDGVPSGAPFLDDYAFMADGLLDLAEASRDESWAELAQRLVVSMADDLADPEGGFYFSSPLHDTPIGRSKPFMGTATPSPNGVAARVLRRTGDPDGTAVVLRAGLGWMQRVPRAAETLLHETLLFLWESDNQAYLFHLGAGARLDGVSVYLEPDDPSADPDGWYHTDLVIQIPSGHHINADEPIADWLVPTSLHIEGSFGEAAFPGAKDGVYQGVVRIPLRLRRRGPSGAFQVTVRYQVCTESECHLPSEVTLTGSLA